MLAKYGYLQWVFTLLLVVASNSFAGGWEQITELPTWRIGGTAAAVNGKIYLIGGFDDHENLGRRAPVLSTVDVYGTRLQICRHRGWVSQLQSFPTKSMCLGAMIERDPGVHSDIKRTLRCMTLPV